MRSGNNLDSITLCVTHHQVVSMGLETHARRVCEHSQLSSPFLTPTTNEHQVATIEPLELATMTLANDQFVILLIIDDGPGIPELTRPEATLHWRGDEGGVLV